MSSLRTRVADYLFGSLDENPQRVRYYTAALLLILCACALALRLPGLAQYHLSGDDAMHLATANSPTVGQLLYEIFEFDTHPPLYYLLQHVFFLWIPVFHPLVPKLMALFCGIAMVPAGYFLGRTVTATRAPGFFLAVLITVSGHMVMQSQVVRHYTLLLLLHFLMLAAFFSRRARSPLPYFAAAALVVCTHFVSAVAIFATGIAGLIEDLRAREKPSRIVAWLAGHALLGALFLSLFLQTKAVRKVRLEGYTAYLGNAMLKSFSQAVREVAYVLSGIHLSADGIWPWVLLLPMLVGTALAIQRRALSLLIIAYVPLIAAVILSARGLYPISHGRWCIWLVPGFLPLLAWTFEALRQQFGRATECAALLAIVAAIFGNLLSSRSQSALSPHGWRRTYQASQGSTPTRAEQARIFHELAARNRPGNILAAPYAQRLRMRTDVKYHWAPAVRPPPLNDCPGFSWEFFTAEQMELCVRTMVLRAPDILLGDSIWFINLLTQEHVDTMLRDYTSRECLPLGPLTRVGNFVLMPVDLRVLRQPDRAARCGLPTR